MPAIIVTPAIGLHVVEGGASDAAAFVGAQSETVRVRLDGPPLANVRVNITSKYGQLSFNPPSLKFDYLNYSFPQKVIIKAVDDHVFEESYHIDTALFNASSSDNCTNVKNPNPGACNQAVAYQGIGIGVDVNITDNDERGVEILETVVNATMDNYGDGLSLGVYGVRLISEPVFNVTVTPLGVGAFTIVSPSSLTFDYLTWNVTQYVYVTATAATSQRPACADGQRYCAALRSRSEMLRHNISSRDPFYHDLKVAKVNVSISTVHDAMPAPILTSARFTDALNGLTLTFDSTTNFGGQTGEFDCSLVLNTSYSMIKAKDTQLFGSSSAGCRFSSPTAIEMTFATSPTIVSPSLAKNCCKRVSTYPLIVVT